MTNLNAHKPGYKHTPLGWVPEEWEVKKLEEVAQIQQGVSKGKSIRDEDAINMPYLRVANVKDGYFDLNEIKQITVHKVEYNKYLLNQEDILITEGGDPDKLGRGSIWQNEVENCIFQNHLFRLRATKSNLNPYYLYNYLQGKKSKDYFLSCAKQTTGIASVNSSQVKAMPVLLPPLPEQNKISTILSTWDAAIAKTQEIIGQLQVRNRGLLQELLTGKRSLKVFEGEWIRLQIGSIASEVSLKNKENKPLTVLSCTKYDGLVDSLKYFGRRIYSEDISTYKIVPKGHFAYATNHIEEGSIGYQHNYPEALISPMYTVFQTSAKGAKVYDEFFFKLLKSHTYIHQYRKRMEGSIDRRGGLRWDEFAKIPVHLPSYEEQIAIANLLNEADNELNKQKSHLTILQTQKKGLMQKLLTGTIRVNII